jgi:hypothetical protein
MTQAEADQPLANLSAHVTDEVNGVAEGPGGRGGPRGGCEDRGPGRASGDARGSEGR